MTAYAGLLAEHGSPLWLVDLDGVRDRWAAFRAAWRAVWRDVTVAYSYKTNRLPALLRTLAGEGAVAEVVCEAELLLAMAVAHAPRGSVIVNGPAKSDAFLRRAAAEDALVVVDDPAELRRAASAGVRRVGVRVALAGVGVEPTRFGVHAQDVPSAVAHARALGLTVQALHGHVVSTGFDRPLERAGRLGAAVMVQWPRPAAAGADAARILGALAVTCRIDAVDLGGGWPVADDDLDEHARAAAAALRSTGFAGRLALEPGRAVVAGAVDLACTVVAVKRLENGRRCVVVDAGTNLVPGALWSGPRIDAPGAAGRADAEPALVTGPLCLNVDVLSPAAALPAGLAPGDVLVVRAVGAYEQAQSTQFGDLRPATVALEEGRWRCVHRRETLEDLLAGDLEPFGPGAARRVEEVEA